MLTLRAILGLLLAVGLAASTPNYSQTYEYGQDYSDALSPVHQEAEIPAAKTALVKKVLAENLNRHAKKSDSNRGGAQGEDYFVDGLDMNALAIALIQTLPAIITAAKGP